MRKNLEGQTFGRLNVVRATDQRKQGNIIYECLCSCGNVALVPTARLTAGVTKSCGCLHGENARSKTAKHVKHGMHGTPTYKTWQSMIARCNDPKNISYKYYGAKGIEVCQSWLSSFTAFLQDMGVRPTGMTLDRIDSNKSYCKENCIWSTYQDQANNRSNNVMVMHLGKKITIAQFAKLIGMSYAGASKKVKREYIVKDGVFIIDHD